MQNGINGKTSPLPASLAIANESQVISYYARKFLVSSSRYMADKVMQLRCLKVGSLSPRGIAVFTLYIEAGWVGRNAILMTGINSLIYLLSTIPT